MTRKLKAISRKCQRLNFNQVARSLLKQKHLRVQEQEILSRQSVEEQLKYLNSKINMLADLEDNEGSETDESELDEEELKIFE